MTEADRFRRLVGAYVTGSLDPEEAAELERHLQGCRACREELSLLGPLPAMLRRLPPPLDAGSAASTPFGAARGEHLSIDRAHLAVLAKRAARRRRSVRAALGAAAAAEAAAAAVVAALLVPAGSAAPARVMAMRGPVATATAELEAKAWGTQILLRAERLPRGTVLVAAVYGPGGESSLGSWSAPPSGRAVVELATSVPPGSIRRLIVFRSGTARIVLRS